MKCVNQSVGWCMIADALAGNWLSRGMVMGVEVVGIQDDNAYTCGRFMLMKWGKTKFTILYKLSPNKYIYNKK